MSTIGRGIVRAACSAALVLLVTIMASVATAMDPRWTPSERADPLEPWSLDAPRSAAPAPLPAPDVSRPALPDSDMPADVSPGETRPPRTGLPEGEGVVVVRCRQLLVGQPARAEQLRALLQQGAQLDVARRSLGGVDVVERTREYALLDLEPDIQAEILALPDGGWSRVRTHGGRAILYQVLDRERRDAGALPELGQGLTAEEMTRVQRLQRPRPAPRPALDETGDSDAAAVVEQVQPEYPPGTSESGTVTVRVRLGRADDVVAVEIERSTNPIFDEPALRAARRSTYRTARRDGIPETSVISLTYNFIAPQTPTSPQTQPNPR